MARKTFFSFHFKNDVWRANQVRNSWVTQGKTAAGFIDATDFEKIEKEGENAVKKWIDDQLDGTTVTVVLIGTDTSNRYYVKYELQQSLKRGNGIVGAFIHDLKDKDGKTAVKGDALFGVLGKGTDGNDIYFSSVAKTCDYVADDGYKNLGDWIEGSLK